MRKTQILAVPPGGDTLPEELRKILIDDGSHVGLTPA